MQKVRNCFKGKLTLLLVCSLIMGMLSVGGKGGKTTYAVAEAATSEANTARSGYGLNNPSTDSEGVTTWDCVWFGNYWQNDTNEDGIADQNDEKEPIKWRVLSVDRDEAFLLADANLDVWQADVQRYGDEFTGTCGTWESCTMRSWLNSFFLKNAFDSIEEEAIKNAIVVNADSDTEGNDTTDKVYVLSIGEATNPFYGFTSKDNATETRVARNTDYRAQGGSIRIENHDIPGLSAGSRDRWWLRSPREYIFSGVSPDGRVGGYFWARQIGGQVIETTYYNSIRPALHLNLSSTSVWAYAGQVTAEGGETGTETPAPTVTSVGFQIGVDNNSFIHNCYTKESSGTENDYYCPSGNNYAV